MAALDDEELQRLFNPAAGVRLTRTTFNTPLSRLPIAACQMRRETTQMEIQLTQKTNRFGGGLTRLPALMTVPEVAAYLRQSERTIWRKIENGELKAVRLGRCVRVPEPSVRALITT